MEFRTLISSPLSQITAAFNEAFRDYFIPLQFTEEGMAIKIKGEGIRKDYSIGAFEEGQLVGFILHGYDKVNDVKMVYNAGTGVVPAFRGRGITKALYRYGIPLLQKEGIYTHQLEVIHNNHPAIKVYEAMGFQTVRKLGAFKSTHRITGAPAVGVQKIGALPADEGFVSMTAAWQNSTASINRDLESHQLAGAFRHDELIGYAVWVPGTGRVKQVAVHTSYRRQKIGTAILQHLQQHSATGHLLLTNVDEDYSPGITFLESLGFEKILGLYEMKMTVK